MSPLAEALLDQVVEENAVEPTVVETTQPWTVEPMRIETSVLRGFQIQAALDLRMTDLQRRLESTIALRTRLGIDEPSDEERWTADAIEVCHAAMRDVERAFGYEPPVGGIEQYQAEGR